MKHPLLHLLRWWVFRVNRTLLLEVLGTMALGLLGLAVVWPAVQWAAPAGLHPIAAGVLMAIAVAMVLAGLWVVHSRWMNATRLVRSLDRFYQTEQLLETGLGVAHGWAVGSEALTQDVRERALLAARRVNLTKWRPIRVRGWVAGLVWVAAGLMLNQTVAMVRTAPSSAPAPQRPQTQLQQSSLPEQARLDLYTQADTLQRLTADPSLTTAASSALGRSAQALREAALSETSQDALVQRLARANDSLEQLLHLAGAQQLVSPGALRALSHHELASTLRSALEQGDLGAVERAASELQRRLNRSNPLKARGIGQSLTDALAGPLVGQPNAPKAPLNPDTLEQVANSMEQVANQLAAGNQTLAQSTLSDALAQLREADPAPSIVEHHANQARSTVANAQQAMADAQKKRSNPDPTPPGASLQAAANPSDAAMPKGAESLAETGPGWVPGDRLGDRGTPMGTQLLDEGEGPRRPGAQAVAGDATGTTGEAGAGPNGLSGTEYPSWPVHNPLNPSASWVQSIWQGAQGGVVRAAQGGSMPTAGRATWQQVHTHYRSLAESAMHQEAIPLSRQDAVRAYFLAIRPPLNDRAQDRL